MLDAYLPTYILYIPYIQLNVRINRRLFKNWIVSFVARSGKDVSLVLIGLHGWDWVEYRIGVAEPK